MTFGERIREYRNNKDLSAKLFAAMIGTSAINVYKWEGGTRCLDQEMIRKIENQITDRKTLVVKLKGNRSAHITIPQFITNEDRQILISSITDYYEKQ